MSDEAIVLIGLVICVSLALPVFALFVWAMWSTRKEAARMQALHKAQLVGVQEAIKRGTRIVNPVPMPSPRQRSRDANDSQAK